MKKIRLDFLRYTSLNILAMVGVSIYILADTYFISKALGAIGLAALNFAIVIFTLIQGVGLMIGIGGAIDFTVRKSEGGNLGETSLLNALLVGLLFSVIFLLVGLFFPTQLSLFLGADEVTLAPTRSYIITILGFSPFFILNNIALAFARNDNNPRLVMVAMIVSSFLNILLDYIFMFPLSMGIFGAAFATGLSPIISLCILTIHFNNSSITSQLFKCKLEIKRLVRILILGLPSFVTEFASSITLFIFNIVILKISGNIGVAAYGVIANVAFIATALFTGLAQGIQPLVSNYFAKSDKNGLRTVLKYSLVTSLLLSVTIYLIIFIFSGNIVAVFNSKNNEILRIIAEAGSKIYFTGFVFAGINIVLISFFSATSNTAKAMTISILRSSLLLIPAVVLLSAYFGLYGVWVSFVITELAVTVLTYLAYGKSLRKNRRVIKVKSFEIKESSLDNLDKIKYISEKTFIETFSDVNTDEDIKNYLKESFSADKLESEIKNTASIFYTVEYYGKVVAYMKLNFDEAQTEKGHDNTLEIQRIYVLKDYKNMRIGKMLMEKAIELGKSKNLSYIWLGVWEQNTSAIKFYEKHGFVKFDTHIFKLGDDEQIDYLMKLNL